MFTTGAILLLFAALVRFTAAFDVENYPLRAATWILLLVNGLTMNGLFFWSYWMDCRERPTRTEERQRLLENNPKLYIEEVANKLHPKDAVMILQRLIKK